MTDRSPCELSVIAPCHDEAANLPELVERVRLLFARRRLAGELILVDDGSRDDSAEVMARLAAAHPFVLICRHPTTRGIVAAWKTGLARARGHYVCLIDADLQYQPEDIDRLYRELRFSHADVAQGWRSSVGRLRDSRWTLSRGLNFLLNACFGMRARDNKSGFVLCRRVVLEEILSHRFHYRYFQTFITVSAHAKGYTIREIETLFESRRQGRSFIPAIPVGVIWWVLIDLIKAIVEFRLLPQRDLSLRRPLGSAARQASSISGARRGYFEAYLRLMPLHHWMITADAGRYHAELFQTQWLPMEAIRQLQLEKLRRLLDHAYHHVGYYREQWQALGFHPSAIRSLADLQQLPVLTREELRTTLYFGLLSDNHRKRDILRISTSGSTGEPLTLYVDRRQLELRWAATLRSMEWAGYRFGDRHARLWHHTIGMTASQIVREQLDSWLCRRLFVPAFDMDDRILARTIARLRRFKPVLIDGYAESLHLLATYLRQNGDARGFGLRGIITSAQTLPEASRRVIEEAFGCPVFDKYGSREFSGIAYECDTHAGHHVVAENHIVEILVDGRPARPGEIGEVVVTDLNNFCVPLIRYRLGDLAEAIEDDHACACGRGLPRIGRIEGRIQAMILGSHGRYVPSSLFLHVMKDYDFAVRQFQVIQERHGALGLRIVKGLRYSDAVLDEILRVLRRYVGARMDIEVEFVDAIPLTRAGKRLSCINRLPVELAGRSLVGAEPS
jgi:phenylacetate-CoA ligase